MKRVNCVWASLAHSLPPPFIDWVKTLGNQSPETNYSFCLASAQERKKERKKVSIASDGIEVDQTKFNDV